MRTFWDIIELLIHMLFTIVYVLVALYAVEAGTLWVAAVFIAAAFYAGSYAHRHMCEQLATSIVEDLDRENKNGS